MKKTVFSVLKQAEMDKVLVSKQKATQAAANTLNDMVVGALAGGLVGAAFGRWAWLAGIATMGAGYYCGVPWLPSLGLGMSASAFGVATSKKLNLREANQPFSIASAWQGAKERMLAFKDNVLEQTHLNKLLNKGASTTTTTGEETVSGLGAGMSELEKYEQQVIASAMDYQQNQVSGIYGSRAMTEDVDFDTM